MKILKTTQKQVLKVLVDNDNKALNIDEIQKLSGVARNHIKLAIIFFMNNNYVYQPDINDRIQVSPEGISIYYNS